MMTTTIPPAGWYPNPDGAPNLRYFDGADWTPHFAAGTPALPDAQRAELLDQAVMVAVSRGARLEWKAGTRAIIVYPNRCNHVLHLLLCLFLCGLWLPVWIFLAMEPSQRFMLQVDPYSGAVTKSRI